MVRDCIHLEKTDNKTIVVTIDVIYGEYICLDSSASANKLCIRKLYGCHTKIVYTIFVHTV